MEEKVWNEMTYLISYPTDFQEGKVYPLLVYLHGRGGRKPTTEKLHSSPCLANMLQRQDQRGYILLAPHCKQGNWSEWTGQLLGLIDHFRSLAYVDTTRVYLTGNSMGGYGTWMLACLRAHWFAAVMPLCGGGIPGMANEYGQLPIRTFHGLRDKTVDPIESLQMAKAINNVGGYAELILFPELSHNCWDTVYADESNYDWLFSFTNLREETAI